MDEQNQETWLRRNTANVLFIFYIGVMFWCVKNITSTVISYPPLPDSDTTFLGFLWEQIDFKSVFFWFYISFVILGAVNVARSSRNRLPRFLCLRYSVDQLSSPTCTSALHFIVILVSIYFSVTSSEINAWLSKGVLMNGTSSVVFSSVVSILFISIIVFVMNQVAIGKKRAQDEDGRQKSYEQKVQALEDIIRFAPPNGFAKVLSEYVDIADDFGKELNKQNNTSEISEACSLVYKNFLKPVNKESNFVFKGFQAIKQHIDLKKAASIQKDMESAIEKLKTQTEENAKYIRAILIAYARLAAHFEGVTPSERDKDIYRATLMLKYDTKDRRLNSEDPVRYMPSVLSKEELAKYLTLHPEHSVKVYSGKMNITRKDENGNFIPVLFDYDDSVSITSMPFFLGDERANYNCIGAPRVLGTCESQFINHVPEEIESWRNGKGTPVEIVDEASEYFARPDKPFSMMSFPLMHSRYDVEHRSAKYVLGVVTISRDKKTMMMGERSKQEQFEHITTPLNFALCKITHYDALHRHHINLLQKILDSVKIDTTEKR